MPATSPLPDLAQTYSALYRSGYFADSPELTRANLLRRLCDVIEYSGAISHPAFILDIGSGPQLFAQTYEEHVENMRPSLRKTLCESARVITADFADIPSSLLITSGRVPHIRADAKKLPFADGSFDVITANMSVDMLRKNPSEYITSFALSSHLLA